MRKVQRFVKDQAKTFIYVQRTAIKLFQTEGMGHGTGPKKSEVLKVRVFVALWLEWCSVVRAGSAKGRCLVLLQLQLANIFGNAETEIFAPCRDNNTNTRDNNKNFGPFQRLTRVPAPSKHSTPRRLNHHARPLTVCQYFCRFVSSLCLSSLSLSLCFSLSLSATDLLCCFFYLYPTLHSAHLISSRIISPLFFFFLLNTYF